MAVRGRRAPREAHAHCMRLLTWWYETQARLRSPLSPSLPAPGPGTPFPDPSDPADAAAASALDPERFAYLPPWLANTHGFGPHNAGGAGWYADALNGGRAAAAATHLHAGLPPGGWRVVWGVKGGWCGG